MRKILSALIEFLYWLQIFFAPVIIGALAAFLVYNGNDRLGWLAIIILALSAIAGAGLAERIRRKYGCSRYLSKILSTPDIWPDEYTEERKKNQ